MRSFSDTSFEKNYVVLFLFPIDRSVDYSELMAFKGNLEVFSKNDCQVVGVTSDSVITIENWIKLEPNIIKEELVDQSTFRSSVIKLWTWPRCLA